VFCVLGFAVSADTERFRPGTALRFFLMTNMKTICCITYLTFLVFVRSSIAWIRNSDSSFRRSRFRTSLASSSKDSHFDYLVIGGGSGGLATAQRAAGYGARVGLIEKAKMGGTCVNSGCVPKKVMFNAAAISETIHQAHHYGFKSLKNEKIDWAFLKQARDGYIHRLNDIHYQSLVQSNIQIIEGAAEFIDQEKHLQINPTGQIYSAEHICISVGGKPTMPAHIPGIEHCLSSDEFFQLPAQPKSVAIYGGGYIGLEIASLFHQLGTTTTLVTRSLPFQQFDELIRDHLIHDLVHRQKMHLLSGVDIKEIIREDDCNDLSSTSKSEKKKKQLYFVDAKGQKYGPFDEVVMAIGRKPAVESLGLSVAGIEQDSHGHGFIPVDDYQNTNRQGIYAIGDVCGRMPTLTPMAVAAGRRLADR
jgi:glutathione reductase (NADPH)